jgi:hypothetical protein
MATGGRPAAALGASNDSGPSLRRGTPRIFKRARNGAQGYEIIHARHESPPAIFPHATRLSGPQRQWRPRRSPDELNRKAVSIVYEVNAPMRREREIS